TRDARRSARQTREHAKQPRTLVGLTLGSAFAVRHQVHLRWTRAEQEAGIDVGVARPRPEMERPRSGDAEHLALPDLVAPLNPDRRQEGVTRADAVAVEQDDVERAADLAGEDHLAVGRRFALGARRSGVVQAAVARAVGRRRRSEGIGDGCGDGWLITSRAA